MHLKDFSVSVGVTLHYVYITKNALHAISGGGSTVNMTTVTLEQQSQG